MSGSGVEDEVEANAWLRAEGRLGRRGSARIVSARLGATLAGISQAFCAAHAIAAMVSPPGEEKAPHVGWYLLAFGCLALTRAGLAAFADRAAFEAGAAARRRLR